MAHTGKNFPGRVESRSKVPEVETNFTHLGNFEKASVGRPVVGAEGRGVGGD